MILGSLIKWFQTNRIFVHETFFSIKLIQKNYLLAYLNKVSYQPNFADSNFYLLLYILVFPLDKVHDKIYIIEFIIIDDLIWWYTVDPQLCGIFKGQNYSGLWRTSYPRYVSRTLYVLFLPLASIKSKPSCKWCEK